jgi:translation machinery-associated protein 16
MPLAKNLQKVQKKVASGSGTVHPKGRKFKQLTRASLRTEKLAKHKAKRTNTKEHQRMYEK